MLVLLQTFDKQANIFVKKGYQCSNENNPLPQQALHFLYLKSYRRNTFSPSQTVHSMHHKTIQYISPPVTEFKITGKAKELG